MPTLWLDKAPLPAGVIRNERFVYANEALAVLLGVPRERVVGMVFTDPVVPEDRARLRERHLRRLRGEVVPDSYEFVLVRADGARRAVEIFVATAPDGDVIFQLMDRTDRVARQANLAAVARLGAAVQRHLSRDAILRAVGTGLLELGVSTTLLTRDGDEAVIVEMYAPDEMVRATEATLGRPLRGLRGPLGDAFRAAWSESASFMDDVPLSAARFVGGVHGEAMRAAARSVGNQRAIMVRLDAGGEPAGALMLGANWLLPDDVPAFTLFATQVSAALDAARVVADLSHRNAELAALNRVAAAAGVATDLGAIFARGVQEIAQVLGCQSAALYLVDPDGQSVSIAHRLGLGAEASTPQYTRVPLPGTRFEAVVREAAPRVWHRGELGPEAQRALDRTHVSTIVGVPLVSRGKVVGVLTVGYRDVRTALEPEIEILQAVGAHFAAALETSRLVDDLRKSYAELSRTQEQLVQRERLAALGELAAAVAHEVRNPLGVIFNSIGSLRRLVSDEAGDARVLLDILSEEAARLNHIVGDLLDFARPVMPAVRPEPLDAVVNDAVEAALGDRAGAITVVREYEPGIGPVPMDPRLVRQAVLNLALNAVQAMDSGGTLRVRIARDDVPEGRGVRVELTDSGGGIAPELQARIFEPFFTTRATGTGLGLAVVRRIIEGHGGSVRVTSAPGQGASASFRLPLEEGSGVRG